MNNITKAVSPEIALQSWLRPALTPVGPNIDYAQFRDQLDAVDKFLRSSPLESMALDFARVGYESANAAQLRRRLEFGLKGTAVGGIAHVAGRP